jgi:hypothetical protein
MKNSSVHSFAAIRHLFGFLVSLHLVRAEYRVSHTFSVKDIIGSFSGKTFESDQIIVCDVPAFQDPNDPSKTFPNAPACPLDAPTPITDKDKNKLYPIDSEFGFDVVDFAGALAKTLDQEYQEGFAGNIMSGSEVVGLSVANAPTVSMCCFERQPWMCFTISTDYLSSIKPRRRFTRFLLLLELGAKG